MARLAPRRKLVVTAVAPLAFVLVALLAFVFVALLASLELQARIFLASGAVFCCVQAVESLFAYEDSKPGRDGLGHAGVHLVYVVLPL